LPDRKWACTSSFQSVGGPRAGESGGGSSGSPRCVRIWLHAGEAILAFSRLRISHFAGVGSCRPSPLSRMSPQHLGHAKGNSSPKCRATSGEGKRGHTSRKRHGREPIKSRVAAHDGWLKQGIQVGFYVPIKQALNERPLPWCRECAHWQDRRSPRDWPMSSTYLQHGRRGIEQLQSDTCWQDRVLLFLRRSLWSPSLRPYSRTSWFSSSSIELDLGFLQFQSRPIDRLAGEWRENEFPSSFYPPGSIRQSKGPDEDEWGGHGDRSQPAGPKIRKRLTKSRESFWNLGVLPATG